MPASTEQGSSSPTWAVELIGKFNARAGSRVFETLPGGRTTDLLAYLLLFRDRPHHREALAGTLWPEICTAQSRKYLRQSLWHLRGLDTTCGGSALITADSEWVKVDAANVWVDVAQVDEVFERVKLLPGEHLHSDQAQALKTVLPLLKGELLEGCYQDWCIYERERLKAVFISLLEKLLGYCEAQGDFEEGLVYGEELLRRDRAHERAHRRLMKLRYLAGDRSGAIRQFERCREALKDELDVEPADTTRALLERIRAGDGALEAPSGPSEHCCTAENVCNQIEGCYLCPGSAHAIEGRSPEAAVLASLEKAAEALSLAASLLEQSIQAVQRQSPHEGV